MSRPHLPLRAVATALLLAVFAPRAHATCPAGGMRLGAPTYTIGIGSYPTQSVIGDFDGDGKPDIVSSVNHTLSSYSAGIVAFQKGAGDGTFGAPVTSAAGITPFGVATGDFNGDGKLDLAVTNNADSTVSILIGHGDGTFADPVAYFAGRQPHHVVAADLNGDGKLDLVIGLASDFAVSVLLGRGDGTFAARSRYALHNYCTGVAVADFNQDGKLDIAATEYTSGTVALLSGNGDGTFGTITHMASAGVVYDVTAADFDHDGMTDLLVSKSGEGLDLHFGLGNGSFGAVRHLADGVVNTARLADFDGDGIPDIAYTEPTANAVGVLHGMSTAGVPNGIFVSELERAVSPFPALAAAGDLNGDGVADFVAPCYTGTGVGVLIAACDNSYTPFALGAIRDVPNDQGGKVWLTWGAHVQDVASGAITGYRVWRRIPAPAASAARARGDVRTTVTGSNITYWEAVASLPSQHLAAYGYTAATSQDSLASGNPWTAFFVTAVTANANVFYDTAIDSGYSVDNLAPAAPSNVQAYAAGAAVTLSWDANVESDLWGYRIWRGADRYFPTDAAHLLGSTPLAHARDDAGAGMFYKVAAVDVHGNIGPSVLVEPNGPVATLVSFVDAKAAPAAVTLDWYVDTQTVPSAALQRAGAEGGAWTIIAQAAPEAGGRLTLVDASVTPGATYRYRLTWLGTLGQQFSPETMVVVPGLELALAGAQPNPAPAGRCSICFSLPSNAPATLELFDVGGRRVMRRDVGALGAGPHTLATPPLRAGVYLARLAQQGAVRHARIVAL